MKMLPSSKSKMILTEKKQDQAASLAEEDEPMAVDDVVTKPQDSVVCEDQILTAKDEILLRGPSSVSEDVSQPVHASAGKAILGGSSAKKDRFSMLGGEVQNHRSPHRHSSIAGAEQALYETLLN